MPKPRNDTLYVKDMHEAVLDIASFVDGYDFARFSGDKKTIAAVLRNFEILGEAASRVPDDMRELAPEIDWRGIKDFRNVIAHFYRGVDLDLVWKLIATRLPKLTADLGALRSKLGT